MPWLIFYPLCLSLFLPSFYLAFFNLGDDRFIYVLVSAFLLLGLPMSLFVKIFFKLALDNFSANKKTFYMYGSFIGALLGIGFTLSSMTLIAILNSFQVLFTASSNFHLQSLKQVIIFPVVFDALQSVLGSFVMLVPGVLIGTCLGYGLSAYIYQVQNLKNATQRNLFIKAKVPNWYHYGLLGLIYLAFLYLANS
jgi:hypothetical protein